MPGRMDASAITTIIMRVPGGEPAPASVLAPKVGPLGMSPKKLGDDIAKATADWKGMGVMVRLEIQNRQAVVHVIPSASALVIKALKEPPVDKKKVKDIQHDGNLVLEDILTIARTMRERSMAKQFKGTVKEILGTANSVGCTVDGKTPRQVQKEIDEGIVEIPDE